MGRKNLHIVLMGDSVFDNGVYTGGGPAVIDQLKDLVGESGRATLLAVDGDRVQDLAGQLSGLPPDATHVIVSAGGNDALDHYTVLAETTDSVADTMLRLSEIVDGFEREYRGAMQHLMSAAAHLTVCTIYNGNFDDPVEHQVVATTVRLFNDAIFRVAHANRVPVIDLRAVCSDPADYANPIEPSSTGGAKIVRAIVDAVSGG